MKKTLSGFGFLVGFLVAVGAPGAAWAQPSSGPGDARAMALFEQARALIESGDCPKAIPVLKETLSLGPSIGAHLSLAECLTADQPLAAWSELKAAQALAARRGDDRERFAREKAALLEPRLALVSVVFVPTEQGGAAHVLLDGAPLDAPVGSPIAVTPGEHVIEASAPGKRPWRGSVVAAVGQVARAQVTLGDETVPPAGPASPTPTQAQPKERVAAPPQPRSSRRRTLAFALGGVGVAGLAAGSIAGLLALGDKNDLDKKCAAGGGSYPSRCGGGTLTPAAQGAIHSEARSMLAASAVSDVGLIVGALGLAAGVTLYLISPEGDAPASVSVGVSKALGTGSNVVLRATW